MSNDLNPIGPATGASMLSLRVPRPAPDTLFRIVVRSVVAHLLTEAVLLGALAAGLLVLHRALLPTLSLGYSVAFGLGAGVAFALGELLARLAARSRFELPLLAALVLGAAFAPLAELFPALASMGGQYRGGFPTPELLLGSGPSSNAHGVLLLIPLALFLHGPLLLARLRRRGLWQQARAALLGGLLGGGLALAMGLELGRLHLSLYLLLLCGRAVTLPRALDLADRFVDDVLTCLGQPPGGRRRVSWWGRLPLSVCLVAGAALGHAGTRPDEPAVYTLLRVRALFTSEREQLRALAEQAEQLTLRVVVRRTVGLGGFLEEYDRPLLGGGEWAPPPADLRAWRAEDEPGLEPWPARGGAGTCARRGG